MLATSMSNARQPWPMKWIVLAILLAIVPYTLVTLYYRKPGPAFRPYEDMKNRANVARLLAAGYQRISLPAEQPADDRRITGGAAIAGAPGGVPTDLRTTLVEAPLLPLEISSVTAGPKANQLLAYTVQFTCELASEKLRLSGVDLYLREANAVLVPTFEPVGGELASRMRHSVVAITVPAGTLKPGSYTVTIAAERASRSWPLEVQ